ncbi:hypothetical protein [Rickettsia endosymbiont of Halotydeus destructor]|uniref:hypothetical protein n=1 Tax=Rickettsia endosymbiont of Halotydeus destructor TaxID=2996754 RepID=UPI003BAE45DA
MLDFLSYGIARALRGVSNTISEFVSNIVDTITRYTNDQNHFTKEYSLHDNNISTTEYEVVVSGNETSSQNT